MVEFGGMAPTAQDRLIELEKQNALITEQMEQAFLFAGVSLSSLRDTHASNNTTALKALPTQGTFHGRQEYLLRWLLKKFQEERTRRCSTAWRLLRLLVDCVPLRNAAKILNEKKFMVILRQAIEEAVVFSDHIEDSSDTVTISPAQVRGRSAGSKKRKRESRMPSGAIVNEPATEGHEFAAELKDAVYETACRIVQLSKPEAPSSKAFISEYVKSAIRMPNVEAARILGAWLAFSGNITRHCPSALERSESLLSPFLDIWDLRVPGLGDAQIFSEHCLTPLLKILSAWGQLPEQQYQLEKLLARSIMVPARTAYIPSKNTNFLQSLVGKSISTDPRFVPVIFDVAIRCILRQGSRPHRSDDTAWLQAIFKVLLEAIGGDQSQDKVNAIDQTLRYCIDHKITLELPFLQLITSQYGLTNESTSWDLLATILKLDSNTFLIPSDSGGLLGDMLMRITRASSEAVWPIIVDQVVGDVLVPLMGEFAKARQLTAFIHHWYNQLAESGNFRTYTNRTINHFSAWEDVALRRRLRELLEPSLTTLQIVEIVEWLEERIKDCKGAVCVLLDVIAAAISQEETRTALRPKLCTLATNFLANGRFYEGYKAQLLHLNTTMLHWSHRPGLEDISVTEEGVPLLVSLLSHKHLIPIGEHSLEALEAFRYMCAGWSVGAVGFRTDIGTKILSHFITNVTSLIETVVESIAQGLELGEEKWGSRVTTTSRGTGWLACAYIYCLLVEYPRVLELCIEGSILMNCIWIASATTPLSPSQSPCPWLRKNHNAFPNIWVQMLGEEDFEDTLKLSQGVINRMLECGSHVDNPIEKSTAYNAFVILCLHQLPLELFSKSNREAILKAWPLAPPDPSHSNLASLSFRMAPLDPAIISLKMRVWRLPSLYDGVEFQELVSFAEHIVEYCQEPKVLLPIFVEVPKLILSHVFATIDQPRSLKYLRGVRDAIEKWFQDSRKSKKPLSYAMIRLVQIVMTAWKNRGASSDGFSLRETTEVFTATFRALLLSNLKRLLQKPEKLRNDDNDQCMSLYSTTDALDAIGVTDNNLTGLEIDATATLISLNKFNSMLEMRFEVFVIEHRWIRFNEHPKISLGGDVTSVIGRQAIKRKAKAVTEQMTEFEKLQFVTRMLDQMANEHALERLLALKHVIASCEDSRSIEPDNGDDDNTLSLSSAYSTLATWLQKANDIRQFCLISNIMEMILRDKARTITQSNIDSTLASITILCSHQAPPLHPYDAGGIYHHLVRLVNAILTSHRLKLQGHFHLVVQTLQSLLHCLFIPSSQTRKSTQGQSFPLWLALHDLTPSHAAAYNRLLNLICDPSVSAVSRPSDSALNLATKKAKALASLHMPFVMSAYIRSQLDMSLCMNSATKNELMPGWYAIFDTMTVDSRKALGESLDASGRAVLAGLVKDWLRFGKWNGV